MKLITAIIRENVLDRVREKLLAAEIYRITVTRVSGRGQQMSEEIYRGQRVVPGLNPKMRLDIACNDEFVEPCVNAILEGARTDGGRVGDGKILITPLEDIIRIRTGERGGKAI
ncbi:MAG: P-II family nitrogen regulator [Phycisphaerae bacterium]|nr:P-II family nitrogen regulator [Phycisphaerae bacterium]